ncbi:oxygen-insensitive NADPH nitroreductase [Metabacillus sp. GX 13764]|uniref:oxygen-insensitive NADPH nitroreductase n=1 Tax=Metabacillus kandeliae TaxID=2900151 RepID=UPI001E28CD6C|nr:oxygen-insensitive NADPH nitroreductase [Metabacillus kandeliae]MCD7034751.1 oxygen-insensitive NADPH nitroreductase [Metabacillus kandeliae]
MNETIERMLQHRSIRKFEDRPLSDEEITTIVRSAQAASSSSFVQAYSIIGVKDPVKKQKLSELAGNQQYVAENGHFFVFCADLHRHELLGEKEGAEIETALESTEKFMVAVIDAALAAQNAAVAAESMGMGICYIGGLRNHLDGVAEILKTPDRVIPLFGLAVGYPAQNPGVKPRLPIGGVYHEDTYLPDEKHWEQLEEYNRIVSEYYTGRTAGARSDTWTGQMAAMLSHPSRMYMKEFVNKKGFGNK